MTHNRAIPFLVIASKYLPFSPVILNVATLTVIPRKVSEANDEESSLRNSDTYRVFPIVFQGIWFSNCP